MVRASAFLLVEQGNFPFSSDAGDADFAAEIPMAFREVAGASPVERTVKNLKFAGVQSITVAAPLAWSQFVRALSRRHREVIFCESHCIESIRPFTLDKSATTILVLRMGAYVEVDVAEFVGFQQQAQQSIVRARHSTGPLDIWMVDSKNGSVETNFDSLANLKVDSRSYVQKGYVNRLENWQDFRDLARDILVGRCETKPTGRQTAPGIWLDDGARVHRFAHITAPAYVGRNTRVEASASIGACSNVECDSEVGFGTTVEESSILPHTRVGTELRVAHAVVEGANLIDLRRNVTVTVHDLKLLRSNAPSRQSAAIEPAEKAVSRTPFGHLPYRGNVLPRALGFLEDES
jgi:hypothetical protein